MNKSQKDEFRALFERLYDSLRSAANAVMRGERAGHTLQATAVLHECFLKVEAEQGGDGWGDPEVAIGRLVRRMRQVLVDHARRGAALKRAMPKTTLRDVSGGAVELELLEVNDALDALASKDQQLATIAELRIFGCLTAIEIAQALSLSEPTARKRWRIAQAILLRSIEGVSDSMAT